MSSSECPACVSFAMALGCEATIAAASVAVSPKLFWTTSYPSEKRKLWHTTVAAIFPAVFAPWYALPGLLELFRRDDVPVRLLSVPANEAVRRALGVSVAHFAFDFTVMAFYARDFRRAMRPALYKQMMFHHLASLLLWPYALFRDKCVVPVAYFMLTEASNAALNLRWLCAELSLRKARLFFDLVFFASYTLVRVAPCFVAFYLLFLRMDWPHYLRRCNLLDIFCTLFIFVPFGLNVFWYSIILNTAKKSLRSSGRQKKKNDDPAHPRPHSNGHPH